MHTNPLVRAFDNPVWDAIFRAITILAVILATWSVVDTRERSECQARYNEIIANRTTALAYETSERDRTLAELAAILGTPGLPPEEYRAKFSAFSAAATSLEQARTSNPAPPPPSELCN